MSHSYHPILFSTEMVKAILEGRKTQTRRTVKFSEMIRYASEEAEIVFDRMQEGYKDGTRPVFELDEVDDSAFSVKCPYGKIGDTLWVREAFGVWIEGNGKSHTIYKSNKEAEHFKNYYGLNFKPSIHMPKSACRLFLQITDIKVERVQDISEEDAIAEGLEYQGLGGARYFYNYNTAHRLFEYEFSQAKDSFETLWQSINGEESWNANPFVWCISFQRIEKPSDFINSIE